MKAKDPRISLQGLRVLGAFLDAFPQDLSGSDIMNSTGAASGSLYPLLARFEAAGWLTSRWEAGDPANLGRPRRRYYKLTALGRTAARSHLINAQIPGLVVAST